MSRHIQRCRIRFGLSNICKFRWPFDVIGSYLKKSKAKAMSLPKAIVYLWVLPTTAIGLLFFLPALVSGGSWQVVDGVLEIHGGFVRFFLERVVGFWLAGGASAMTLGHVVLGRDRRLLELTRRHERVHVRQCQRWGPLFLPAYLLASLACSLRGQRPYEDNPFEREAYELAP